MTAPLNAPAPQPEAPLDLLVVEDDMTIARNLLEFLALRGHRADVAYDGKSAIAALGRQTHDVILLDLGLPGADGYDVILAARNRFLLSTPILVLTARDALEARLRAFSLGADDYVSKPFALAEVEARVVALHRRATGRVVEVEKQVGTLRFNHRKREAFVGDRPVRLMPRSMLLLERLMRDPGELVERRELERLLWPNGEGTPKSLRGQVYLLRRSLLEVGFDGLETVHGLGVRLRE
ncbi:MAG: response regulator transcription factor [Lautropia sp.]